MGAALLDTDPRAGVPEDLTRFSALGLDPVEVISHTLGPDPLSEDPISALEALHQRSLLEGLDARLGPRPMVMCALAYDLGRCFERLPALRPRDHTLPDLWAARYSAVYVWDHLCQRGRITAESPEAAAQLAHRLAAPASPPAPLTPGTARPAMDREAYLDAIAQIREHIRLGDVYQVNFTLRFTATLPTSGSDPAALFSALRRETSAPFAVAMRLDADRAILSVSPERYLKWRPGGVVETRPIKGTRPRGADAREDAALSEQLQHSAKDRAEHIMIVDLERNDLGRLCVPGTVRPSRLLAPEAHPTVHHLVSTVEGVLRPQVGLNDLLQATFPGGSITGAPKIRAMEIIEQLEQSRRGIYCGALGYLDALGGGDLNLPIRTAWVDGDQLVYPAGGGIVIDSDGEEEWAEVAAKAAAFTRACGG